MITILGLDGSPFVKSTTGKILAKAIEGCQHIGASTETIRLADVIKAPFHGVYDPASVLAKEVYDALPALLQKAIPRGARVLATDRLFPPELLPLIEKIEAADGFICATPVWWSSPSDYTRILLNYLTICDYRDYSLSGKAAGLISICEEDGAQSANMLMANALTHMGVLIPPFCSFYYNRKMVGRSEQNWQETDQVLVGANIARMCQLLRGKVTGVSWDWNSV